MMATNCETKTSHKKPKKKNDDDSSVDIKRGTCSSNWQNFQSKKLKTEPSKSGSTPSNTSSMSDKSQTSNTSKKLHEVKIREKENFTRKSSSSLSNHKLPTPTQSTSKPDLKTPLNTVTKEKNSPAPKRRARVESKRNQLPQTSNATVVYQNSNFNPPSEEKTLTCKTTFQIPFTTTSNLVVSDLEFLRQPGVVGNAGVCPVINEDVCVGMDCEMVGVGSGRESMLARVSLVNMSGDCIYDTFVLPQVRVVDYRTAVSGVRPEDIYYGADFHIVRKVVATLIHNRILVGHALNNDLDVLGLSFPKKYIRDTAYYTPFQHRLNTCGPPSLKRLAKELLDVTIQDGEHSSVEDARAAMRLYVLHRQEWEKHLRTRRFNNRY